MLRLLLPLIVVLAVSRIAAKAAARAGLPGVVGEMAAGILLGPSLFGLVAPAAFAFVFPPDSLGALQFLAQVGVCLFMFVVGMELDLAAVRARAGTALAVSHASIAVPFLLGVGLAGFLPEDLAGPRATPATFALFLGVSLAVTAFPVLARILKERGLTGTLLGSIALTSAAFGDATAWALLAFVAAIAHAADLTSAILTVVLALGFALVMVFGVRRALARWRPAWPVVAVVAAGSAWATQAIGVHAIFGAFLAGAVMPEGVRRAPMTARLEAFGAGWILPLFFAFTGLRTQITLVGDLDGWLLCLLVIAVATAGKLGAAAAAARATGMGWRDALQLGALMNTRGLMELIVLHVGYELGILSPRLFAVLVVMALVTTLMTGPLLSLFGYSLRLQRSR